MTKNNNDNEVIDSKELEIENVQPHIYLNESFLLMF
jgi:hypothetical protein